MRDSLTNIIWYVLAVFVYSTMGILTKNIDEGFYMGTIIGGILMVIIILLVGAKGRKKE